MRPFGVAELYVRPLRTRMKKWIIILALGFVGVWVITSTVRDAVDAIRYFSSQPHELFYVAAIAITGGLAALGFDRLPPRTKQHFRIFAWGAAASILTGFAGLFGFIFIRLSSFIGESCGTALVLFVSLILSGIAAYLWFVFYRALKTGVS